MTPFQKYVPDQRVRIGLIVALIVISVLLIIYYLVPIMMGEATKKMTSVDGLTNFLGVIAPFLGLGGLIVMAKEKATELKEKIKEEVEKELEQPEGTPRTNIKKRRLIYSTLNYS
jgi:type III secretory pathway component EscU